MNRIIIIIYEYSWSEEDGRRKIKHFTMMMCGLENHFETMNNIQISCGSQIFTVFASAFWVPYYSKQFQFQSWKFLYFDFMSGFF